MKWQVVQVGAGYAHVRTPLAAGSGLIAALTAASSGRLARNLQAAVVTGPRGYGTLEAQLTGDVTLGPLHARPAAAVAWASPGTPPDELPGAGGPESFMGLRPREWRGRSLLWGEMRLTRALYSVLEVHVTAQAARVRQPWSRADFDDRFRFAGGAGARANIPFGPLEASWGVTEGGVHRIEMGIGERF